jgi:glutathione-regulated potassium-efflux system ancillary protein KefG
MANKIIIQFAHPLYEGSTIHKALLNAVPQNKHILVNDLYEKYPFFNINIKEEQRLLLDADVIIWQYPLYWYSMPPLLKQWIDLVFEHGWAYGKNGNQLKGKFLLEVISTGSKEEAYQTGGEHAYSIQDYLISSKQTAAYCNMVYLSPFVVFGSNQLKYEKIEFCATQYKLLLEKLVSTDLNNIHLNLYELINHWIS